MPFRVLVVENEVAAREQLRNLLSLDPDCDLIGECSNAVQAIRSVDNTQPDILYADVTMPEMDAFELLRAIAGRPPLVILTSGHSRYAVRAFEAHVFDYLLKPFDASRFHESLSRAKSALARGNADPGSRVLNLLENMLPAPRSPERIAVRQNGRVLFLKLEEIDWIEAADNYVNLHCGPKTHLLRITMSEVEARLSASRFVRIHRSAIVNIDRIKELQPWFRGDFQVLLRDGTKLTLSKNHRRKLDSQLLLGSLLTSRL
jgi:two-component system, LytTR family, response regulator